MLDGYAAKWSRMGSSWTADPESGFLTRGICLRRLQEVKATCNVKGGCETGRHQGGRSRSHPLLLRLGYGALPDMRLAQSDVHKLQLHESFAQLKKQHGASAVKATEWR